MCKKCGIKTRSRQRERYIVKTSQELPTQVLYIGNMYSTHQFAVSSEYDVCEVCCVLVNQATMSDHVKC